MIALARCQRRQKAKALTRKRRSWPVMAAVLLATISAAPPASVANARPSCKPPGAILEFSEPLPRLKQAIERSSGEIRIVAFGSSSTKGTGATSRDKTYPERLLMRLKERFPDRNIAVLNRGRGGDLASHMLARMDRDVIAAAPHLVIWQTGVNDAIQRIEPAQFRRSVETGLAKLAEQDIDVVLLNQQFYPGARRVSNYPLFVSLVREIGSQHGVPVFRRYELMSHLVATDQFSFDELLAPDRFHLNDLSYDCLGTALADALLISSIRADSDLSRFPMPVR